MLYTTPKEYLFNLEATSSSEAKRLWKKSIKEQWNMKCAYCGSSDNLSIDHIVPKVKGGTDRVTNLLCACVNCNKSKGHQYWADWYLAQDFFTTERLSAIIEWQKQITKDELVVYQPRKIPPIF